MLTVSQETLILIEPIEIQVEVLHNLNIVKLRQGSGKDGQGMALKAKGLKA